MESRFFGVLAADSISTASRGEWIVGPAILGFEFTFNYTYNSDFIGTLHLQGIDGLSVHPNCSSTPESIAPKWSELQRVAREWNSEERKTAFISSGWGYSSVPGQMTEDQQANYAVRSYFANLASGVNLSILYDWKDDGTSPTDPEAHFGVVHSNRSPKQAYRLIQAVTQDLSGYKFSARIPQGDPNVYVFRFRKKNATKLYGWIENGEDQLVETSPRKRVRLTQRPTLIP